MPNPCPACAGAGFIPPEPITCGNCDGTGRSLTWLPPGTASTWICRCGAVNPRTVTTCGKCGL